MSASVRRRWLALGVAALLSAPAPSVAGADELTITAQAVAAHGEFLTQAPPPPTQGVLCLVDSGVDLNPDTQPILIGRESIFGGTLDDVTSYHHGTYVAMVAGAAANGWGMVGAWPWLKVLSVRVMQQGSEHLGDGEYRQGIQMCVRARNVDGVDIRAVELALGGPQVVMTSEELANIRDAVAFGRQNGLVVVSAAGNDGGAVNAPASIDGVLGISAADAGGELCSFSSRGSEVDLVGLGCNMDIALSPTGEAGLGQSTSLASAYVAGAIVALRSYRPDLSVEQTESLLRDNADPTTAGRFLDLVSAFHAAGLGALVDAYRPQVPLVVGTPQQRCDARRRVCSRPRVISVRRHGGRVVIRLASIPRMTKVTLSVDGRRVLQTRSRVLKLRLRRWKTITIRFVRPGREPSATVRVSRSRLR